jgi:hypothetical protein
MDLILITAKPSATDVHPYNLFVSPFTLSAALIVSGKSFIQPKNLYLSAADVSIFNGLSYTFFDPFSSVPNLTDKNKGFTAYAVPEFVLINDKNISFFVPNEILQYVIENEGYQSYLDIIVENEAGYGLLSRDSYSWSVSSWSGFQNIQKPCINGVFVANIYG